MKVRGGRKEIVLPPDAATGADVRPRSALIVALARAHRWQKMLDTGAVGSMDELASDCAIDRCYVRRILALTSLAPDIVEAIIADKAPDGLSLRRFTQRPVPSRWDEQRKVFVLEA